jgi:hypothetical protein
MGASEAVCVPVKPDKGLEQSKLRVEVVSARIRLRLVEQQHERVLAEGSPSEVVSIGREYAGAVQAYSTAVMTWLSSTEKYGHQSGQGNSGDVTG